MARRLNTHTKKLMGHKRFIQLLRQHQYDTGLGVAFINPPYTEEEHAQARSIASEIDNQLVKVHGPRVASLARTLMYQALIDGMRRYVEGQVEMSRVKRDVDVTAVAAITDVQGGHDHGN